MVVVELRNHTTCTQEIPVTHQGREVYVEPLSLVIWRSATPVKCERRTPPQWKIGKKWFCGYPEIRPCNGPGPLPGHRRTNVQEMSKVADLDLEKEIEDYQQKEDEHNKPTHAVLEELATDISRRWLGVCAGLEAIPGIIGTAMLGISTAEMVLSTAVGCQSFMPGKVQGLGWQRQYGARHSKWSSCPAGGPWSGARAREK
jgi:hypothetical protein